MSGNCWKTTAAWPGTRSALTRRVTTALVAEVAPVELWAPVYEETECMREDARDFSTFILVIE